MTRVAVVVVSWNTRELLLECLASLRAVRSPELEVIVVDNASDDGSADAVAQTFPEVRLLRNGANEGFARGCNQGLEASEGEWVLLLNSDAAVPPDTIGRLVEFLESHADYAAAAPRLLDPDGSTQRSCMRLPRLRTALAFGTPLERWRPHSPELERYFYRDFDHEHDADVEQPPAACLLLRRAALDQVGPLDERLALYFNDVDLSRRLDRAGWGTRFVSSAVATHHVGQSTRQHPERLLLWHAGRLDYYRKHHGLLAGLLVKACVLWTWADFVAGQLVARLRGRREDAQPLQPVLRSLGSFLVR